MVQILCLAPIKCSTDCATFLWCKRGFKPITADNRYRPPPVSILFWVESIFFPKFYLQLKFIKHKTLKFINEQLISNYNHFKWNYESTITPSKCFILNTVFFYFHLILDGHESITLVTNGGLLSLCQSLVSMKSLKSGQVPSLSSLKLMAKVAFNYIYLHKYPSGHMYRMKNQSIRNKNNF